ncbi:MFS transporter [Alkalicoccobacillus porphyridii]|uniref:MFS transporter n=1 Tax=Alkalicoccobacillus porphyridii TaxID=2597270 RepID=UPI00163D4D8D|nr:MFS transporter [Alkalicoccobacillus porphyridii]
MDQTTIFQNRNLIFYFLGTILFKLGDKVYLIAIPWLVYDLTQSSSIMGSMFLFQTLPLIIISPIAGIMADRFPRKKIMIYCAIIQGCLVLLIPILYRADMLAIPFIFLLGFLIASAGACFNVTNGTIIPQLFTKDQLMRVNSFFQFIDTSSVFFGSMIAGLLISTIGIYAVFIVIGCSYFPIIISLIMITLIHKMDQQTRTTSWQSLKDGAMYLWNLTILRSLTWLVLVVNIANGALVSMLVFFSRDELGMTSHELGWVYGGAAVAQIAGILLVNLINKRNNPLQLMVITLSISAFGIIGTALSWDWISLMIFIAIQSAPVIMFNVLNKTFRQQVVPSYILGRVNGMMMMIGLASLPLAGFLTGMMSEVVNIRWIFVTLGLVSLYTIFRFRTLGTQIVKTTFE